MAEAPPALAPREMRYARRRDEPDIESRAPQPATEIDVLIIKEVSLVETANRGEHFAPEREEHAGNPVGRERLGADSVVEPRRQTE